jgi:hypothetical protein
MRPQLAMVAEREPEAIIPLSRLSGGMGGISISVSISGMDLRDRAFARKIGELAGNEIVRNLRMRGLGRVD